MSTALNLGISVLIPCAAGYACFLTLFGKERLPWGLTIPLSYGFGVGLLALWMHWVYMAGWAMNVHIIRIPMILITIGLFAVSYFRRDNRPGEENVPGRPSCGMLFPKPLVYVFVAVLLIFIGQNVLYVLWRSVTIPVFSWDAIATISFKAKLFFHEPAHVDLNQLPHKAYPLSVAFLESWVAFNLGYWDDALIKIFFPLTFVSYMILHYKFLSDFSSRTWAVIGCAIVLTSNFFLYHATIGYRDFTIMYFNCAAIMLLIYWSRRRTNALLLAAALFSGFCALTKLEGAGYFVIHLMMVVMILWSSKPAAWAASVKKFLLFGGAALAVFVPYHLYKISAGIAGMAGRMQLAVTGEGMAKLPALLGEFASNLFLSGNWNIIWAVFFISLACGFEQVKRSREIRLLLFPVIMFFLIYLAVLTLTSAEMVNVSFGLLSRVILHFFPLTVLIIVLLNDPAVPEESVNA